MNKLTCQHMVPLVKTKQVWLLEIQVDEVIRPRLRIFSMIGLTLDCRNGLADDPYVLQITE